MDSHVAKIVEDLAAGRMTAADGLEALRNYPTENVGFARVDHHRRLRQGLPEVVYGEGKTPEQITAIVELLKDRGHPVLVTRLDADVHARCGEALADGTYHELSRTWRWHEGEIERTGDGAIVVAAAGTSDLSVAEEAAITAELFGNEVVRVTDVGVAGIHRLLGEVETLRSARVVIAVAGMEGALASVAAGLVSCPVIAVPTSVGYGASFGGVAALLAMLNSCAAGVSVVNIDNGFGAAVAAHLIVHPTHAA